MHIILRRNSTPLPDWGWAGWILYRKDATKRERRRKEKKERREKKFEGEVRERVHECERWKGDEKDTCAYL